MVDISSSESIAAWAQQHRTDAIEDPINPADRLAAWAQEDRTAATEAQAPAAEVTPAAEVAGAAPPVEPNKDLRELELWRELAATRQKSINLFDEFLDNFSHGIAGDKDKFNSENAALIAKQSELKKEIDELVSQPDTGTEQSALTGDNLRELDMRRELAAIDEKLQDPLKFASIWNGTEDAETADLRARQFELETELYKLDSQREPGIQWTPPPTEYWWETWRK